MIVADTFTAVPAVSVDRTWRRIWLQALAATYPTFHPQLQRFRAWIGNVLHVQFWEKAGAVLWKRG